MANNAGPRCMTCGGPTKKTAARKCRRCFQRENAEQTEEELEAIIAHQRANLPIWWDRETEKMRAAP